VWTTRWVQVVEAEFGMGSNAVMCSASLYCGSMTAGPRWVPRTTSKQLSGM
jgi:hypothetical protein